MKKMFFTAIALLAFSATSMANNSVNLKLKKSTKNCTTTKIKLVRLGTCLDNWMADYDAFHNMGMSDEAAIRSANVLYRACLR